MSSRHKLPQEEVEKQFLATFKITKRVLRDGHNPAQKKPEVRQDEGDEGALSCFGFSIPHQQVC